MRRRLLLTIVVCIAVLVALRCGGSPTEPTPTVAPPPTPSVSPLPAVPLASPLPQVFVGAGDIAMCDGNAEATARLLDRISGTVFTLGDNAYPQGSAQEFRDCYDPTWGRHRSRTHPVPGNHDYQTPGASAYFDYFGLNAGLPGRGYYTFEVGAWHVIALNSNIPVSAGSAQGAWLRGDLAASNARCTLAYWHYPLFTSGPDGPSPQMRDFWQILYDAGAEVVLNGHEHLYERFAPQDPDGRPDPAKGIREFIAGTGGASTYQAVTNAPNSEVRITGAFGVLKLTLLAERYDWEFVPVQGRGDGGTGACH